MDFILKVLKIHILKVLVGFIGQDTELHWNTSRWKLKDPTSFKLISASYANYAFILWRSENVDSSPPQ